MRVWLGYLPGWALMVVLSLIAMWVSSCIAVEGKVPGRLSYPVEASALVVILGIVLRNTWGLPARCVAGIKAAEKLLVLGIVLLGFNLNYHEVANKGASILTIILVTMGVGLVAIYFLS